MGHRLDMAEDGGIVAGDMVVMGIIGTAGMVGMVGTVGMVVTAAGIIKSRSEKSSKGFMNACEFLESVLIQH